MFSLVNSKNIEYSNHNSDSLIHLHPMFTMSLQLSQLIFHIMCNDLVYELEIFEPIVSKLYYLIRDTLVESIDLLVKHDLDRITVSNQTLFVNDCISA